MQLLVLDGNSIINRAFYGIKLLTTKDGQYTNALYGFLNIFQKLREQVRPDHIAAAFDLSAPTFRHQAYDAYKAGRKGMPDELAQQLPILKEILTLMGCAVVEKEGYEADDILGTLACAAAALRCALGRPDVSVRCIRDGEELFFSPGDNKLDSCVYSLLGRELAKTLLPCEGEVDGVRVHGFISSPSAGRGSRVAQVSLPTIS